MYFSTGCNNDVWKTIIIGPDTFEVECYGPFLLWKHNPRDSSTVLVDLICQHSSKDVWHWHFWSLTFPCSFKNFRLRLVNTLILYYIWKDLLSVNPRSSKIYINIYPILILIYQQEYVIKIAIELIRKIRQTNMSSVIKCYQLSVLPMEK